jgi:hypothetical protein
MSRKDRELDKGTRRLLMVAGAATGAAVGRMQSSEGNRTQHMIAGAIAGAAVGYLVAPLVERQLERQLARVDVRGLLSSNDEDE